MLTSRPVICRYALIIIFSLLSQHTCAETFRCSISGKIIYTDKPCNGVPPSVNREAVNSVQLNKTDMPVINGRGYNSQIWLIGANGLDRALALSNEFHAPIMIYYQADWCGYCRRLEKELLSNLGAKDILAGVIKVLLSPEFGGRDKQLFKQMGGNGYPSIYFMKNGNSPPKKEWLMKQINGQWQTIRVSELALLVKSIQH